MKAVKLFFQSPVRAGSAGLGLESTEYTIHSDTLFGAIANALRNLNEDIEEFIEKVKNREILLSSCFPFREDTYYLPTPHVPAVRRAGFLPKDTFEKLALDKTFHPESLSEPDFMKKVEIPKVALDRMTSNSSVYYISAIKFEKDSGLYFLVDGRMSDIRAALRYLSDEGIGGKRTWGLGKFHFKVEDFKLRGGNVSYVTLSLTYPTDISKILYWKPVVRGGWINSPNGSLRKPKVIMASEGSIFREEDPGALIDLDDAYTELSARVGHKVYVNGNSFLVGFGAVQNWWEE